MRYARASARSMIRFASHVRISKAQGSFGPVDGGFDISVGIKCTFDPAAGADFGGCAGFQFQNSLLIFGTAALDRAYRDDMLGPPPPFWLSVVHKGFEEREPVFAFQEGSQFVDSIGSGASKAVLGDALGDIEVIGEKAPCFAGFQHLTDCGDG